MNSTGPTTGAEIIRIKGFRATDDPGLCSEFLRQHRKVLEDFGIANVTTNTEYWTTDPDTYVITAISDRAGMVAGIRVEMDKHRRPLPIEEALHRLDPSISDVLSRMRPAGNGEVCGLWNANSHGSLGLPALLAFAAVSIANQIDARKLTCLVAHYTIRHALRAGFVHIEELGNNGTFVYPIPSIKAIAMAIPDALTLASAPSDIRKDLISLRLRPRQVRETVLGERPIRLEYDLNLHTGTPPQDQYMAISEDHAAAIS